MESKIKQYVDYQFRFDQREDLEDLKAEIIANMIDRYNENLKKGKDEETAYIDAVKSMGDFSEHKANHIPAEYSVKPSIADTLLMCGAILSIFALILTITSLVIGTLITALSIITFSGAAYYLYSQSQFIRKEELDIKKHHVILTKIYKYMKTAFAFWTISLSLIFTRMVMNFITMFAILDDPMAIVDDLKSFIIAYIILFILFFVIFVLVFKFIYDRLMVKYYLLTGSKQITGKISDSIHFLYGSDKKRKPLMLSKYTLPIIGIVMIIPQLFIFNMVIHKSRFIYESPFAYGLLRLLFSEFWYFAIVPVITLGIIIVLMIRMLMDKLQRQWLLILCYFIYFISSFSLDFFDGANLDIRLDAERAYAYSLIMVFALIVVVILRNFAKSTYRTVEEM